MKELEKLLQGNREFINHVTEKDPDFFKRLSNVQRPEYLWIGCSDSRIPTDRITNQLPGTFFVHRNIANQIFPTDFNVLSIIYFSLYHLKIRKIIICGHYNCGGVTASVNLKEHNKNYGFLEYWLYPLKELYNNSRDSILKDLNITDPSKIDQSVIKQISNKLSERNVIQQIQIFKELDIVKQFVLNEKETLYIYGMIYNVEDGKLIVLKEEVV